MRGLFSATAPGAALSTRSNVGNGVELRIFTLGDSITNGYKSSDDNGYRIGLQRSLAGSKVLFVGSKTGGTMENGITQIADQAKSSQRSLDPNIILVHAGTNDLNMSPPLDPDNAPDRLGALIDQLLLDSPDAVILVAQIIHAANGNTNALIEKYDDAIPGVVAQRAANHKVAVVDMRSKLQASDLSDGLHPNDGGYQKMANAWFKGIEDAARKGWIKAPKSPPPRLGSSESAGRRCLSKPFWVEGLKNKPIATGVGRNGDMKFHGGWAHNPDAASGIGKNGAGVMFADMNGDGRADYMFINKTTGSVILYHNTGRGDEIAWVPVNDGKEIASGLAPRELVRFADMDLDGKDDYIVLGNETGSVTVWLNRGLQSPGHYGWDGPHEIAPGAPGAKGKDVFFADINGDGRPDYLVKSSKGAISAFLNIGKPKTVAGIKWEGAGKIAAGLGTDDISLADISGDGRADYLIWSKTGGITGYLNYRTEKETQPGWSDMGPMGSFAGGLGPPSNECRLADLNGDGKADYAIISDSGAVDLYLNKGNVETSVIGDGVRIADLNGDGLDDYVWLAPNAGVTLYINGGRSKDSQSWIWYPENDGKEIANGAGASREQIILADMDGDGKEDFCIIDPKSGAVTLYKNGGRQADGQWRWIPTGPIASGIGGPGKNVRLADLDGMVLEPACDGKADYILLGPNGQATLYLNKGEKAGGWNWIPYDGGKEIASGIGILADFVEFKDIDGDGKADYIGIGQLDGSAIVYINHGPQPDGGWGWVPQNDAKPVASGVGSVGRDVRWGRMEKNGRYSYLALTPNSGALRAWLNGCDNLSPATGGSSGGSSGSSSPSGSGSSSSGSGSTSSGGAGNPGSGEDSSDGSNDNDSPVQYLPGGLQIPASGDLGAIGLTTVGVTAIAALIPYAITAQNALLTAEQALKSLTSGSPKPAAVSQAVQALEIASKGQSLLSTLNMEPSLNSFRYQRRLPTS
ncbi:MAG: hypothetical protein Q9193_003670 [Seirophora villosa]